MIRKLDYLKARILAPVILVIICFLMYYKAIYFNFLNFDDDQNILFNKSLLNLDFKSIWTDYYFGMYIPVTYSVWAMLTYLTSSPSASVFHFLNIFLHSLNAILVFYIIKEVLQSQLKAAGSKDYLPALLGAILFCVHPMQVETVSWVSCGRDLLSASFAFASILLFLSNSRSNIIWASGLFYCALLSKPSIAPVAFFLFGYEFYFAKKPLLVALKKTWVLMLGSLITIWVTNNGQSDVISKNIGPYGLFDSLNNSMNSMSFYISKIMIPCNLSANYSGVFNEYNTVSMFYFKLFFGLAMATLVKYSWPKIHKVVQIGFVFFLLTISVILGIIPFAFQSVSPVADRYVYVAMLGVSIIFSFLMLQKNFKYLGFTILLIIAAISFRRVDIWEDNKTFYTSIYKYNPNNYIALTGLGFLAFNEKKLGEAEQFFIKGIEKNPLEPNAIANYMVILANNGQFNKLISVANIYLTPQFLARNFGVEEMSTIYSNVGYAQFKLGRIAESIASNCSALKNNPANQFAQSILKEINLQIGKSEIQIQLPDFCKSLFLPN